MHFIIFITTFHSVYAEMSQKAATKQLNSFKEAFNQLVAARDMAGTYLFVQKRQRNGDWLILTDMWHQHAEK